MRPIKFRHPLPDKVGGWHYWGFLEDNYDGFTGPIRIDLPQYQFTGLLDKNGKEIYEGDVVQIKSKASPNRGDFCAVRWNDCEAGWWWGWDSGENFTQSVVDDTEIEVIGNIYEHPNLVEVSK